MRLSSSRDQEWMVPPPLRGWLIQANARRSVLSGCEARQKKCEAPDPFERFTTLIRRILFGALRAHLAVGPHRAVRLLGADLRLSAPIHPTSRFPGIRRTPDACGEYPGPLTAVVHSELTTARERSRISPLRGLSGTPGGGVGTSTPSVALLGRGAAELPRTQGAAISVAATLGSALAAHTSDNTRRRLGPRERAQKERARG